MKVRGQTALRLLLWALLGLRAWAQQGGEITGLSAQSAGRAGAGAAAGDSVLDAARNPAALGFLFGSGPRQPRSGGAEIVLRGFAVASEGETAGGADFRAETALGGGVWLGWATEVSDATFFGLTLSPTLAGAVQLERETELQVGTPTRFREVQVDNNVVQVALQPAFAWRATGNLALGAGAALRHTRIGMQSAAEFDTLETFGGQSPFGMTWGEFLSSPPFNIRTMQSEYDGDAEGLLAADGHVGLLWAPAPQTRVGAWYRTASTAGDIEGALNVNLNPEMGPILRFYGLDGRSRYDVAIRDVSFPQQLGFAVAHAAGPRDRLFADVAWTDWSSTFDGWTVFLSRPSNPDFRELVGGSGAIELDLDLRWDDTYAFSWGYEHDVAPAVTLRGGVGWSSDPTAGSVGPGTHAFNSWHVALGASVWGERGDWHFALAAALPDSDDAGRNRALSDFSYDRYRVAIYSLVVGYALRW